MNIFILPKSLVVKFCAAIISLVVITSYALFGVTLTSTINSILLGFLLIFVIGKTILILIRKLPKEIHLMFYKSIFPDINGTWSGSISSNWEQNATQTNKQVSVAIKHDLFITTMSFISEDGLTSSELVMSKIERDTRLNKFKLYYLFDALTPQHEKTDERSHHGAACLTINFDKEPPEMNGTYWTDRNWRTNQNTAGEIHLSLQEEQK